MKPIPRRIRVLGTRFFAALGLSAIPIGILAPLAPTWWDGKWWLVLLVAALAAVWSLLGLRTHDPIQIYRDANVTIRLIFGDIFDQNESVMVGMATTFDTEPGIISNDSLQGAFLRRYYQGSVPQLDNALAASLAGIPPVDTIAKTGKQIVYPVGTVATIRDPSGICYHCVAYTTMDAHNRATGNLGGVLDALDSTWDAVDRTGNGRPICVPLIGQGQARIPELSAELSVRLIAFSFLLRSRRSRFSRELRIVVLPSEKDKIRVLEFQDFLSSLVSR